MPLQLHSPNGGNPRGVIGAFYRAVIERLDAAGIPFLVGGGYAMEIYTRLHRRTKDLDIFVMPGDVSRTLAVLEAGGYRCEQTDPGWLAKAFLNRHFVDVIYGAQNRLGQVDRDWFRHARPGRLVKRPVLVCPPEEMIWHKCFVMSRDRYDGADVTRLLRAFHAELQWERLLARFDSHWPVLLSHLILFRYVYPAARSPGLDASLADLAARLALSGAEPSDAAAPRSRAALLSPHDPEPYLYEPHGARRIAD